MTLKVNFCLYSTLHLYCLLCTAHWGSLKQLASDKDIFSSKRMLTQLLKVNGETERNVPIYKVFSTFSVSIKKSCSSVYLLSCRRQISLRKEKFQPKYFSTNEIVRYYIQQTIALRACVSSTKPAASTAMTQRSDSRYSEVQNWFVCQFVITP